MKGRDLQKAVIDLAHLHQWRVCHFQSVLATRKDGSASWRTPFAADGHGWPDLFLVRPGEALAIEIKGTGDKLRPEQQEWLEALNAAGIKTLVATPQNWRSGHIDGILRKRHAPPPPLPRINKTPATEHRGI